jgi:hypothetical protein
MKSLPLAFVLLSMTPALADYRPQDEWERRALTVMREENKTVLRAQWSQRGSLWVWMRDNGSRRDGYAATICLQLADAGMPAGEIVFVRVLDADVATRGEWREIGNATCA